MPTHLSLAAVVTAALSQCCLVAAAMAVAPSSSPTSMARRAIELSNKANVDPSFATEACNLWSSILDTTDASQQLPLPLNALPAAHALFASTLARIGRDKEAIIEYNKSLTFLKDGGDLFKPLTKEESDIRIGMGKALQRMLRYHEAADEFLGVVARCVDRKEDNLNWVHLANSESVQSAALCFMRIGDLDSAISIAEKFDGENTAVDGMHGVLLLLQSLTSRSTMKGAKKQVRIQTAWKLLHNAANESTSPLYKWVYLTSQNHLLSDMTVEPFRCMDGDVYLSFAKFNNSPFDDPDLINLDDKILLHSMVTGISHCDFWPQGYILPDNMDLFIAEEFRHDEKDLMSKKQWILKERSGYGSHGNSIATTEEVLMSDASNILCQRIVEPPMLIDGRKFSLRIYVVYFPAGQTFTEDGEETKDAKLYVSTEGLVKYASAAYDTDGKAGNDDQYMTNSGRGDGRSSQQHDLRQLQKDFDDDDVDYHVMWERIEESIQIVMKRYIDLKRDNPLAQDALAGRSNSGYSFIRHTYHPLSTIPKILGFDYILDSSVNPYLLEINRFPGLEPRSSMDSRVKHSVVYDAWIAASDRIGISKQYIQHLRPSDYKEFSLEKLSLT